MIGCTMISCYYNCNIHVWWVFTHHAGPMEVEAFEFYVSQWSLPSTSFPYAHFIMHTQQEGYHLPLCNENQMPHHLDVIHNRLVICHVRNVSDLPN